MTMRVKLKIKHRPAPMLKVSKSGRCSINLEGIEAIALKSGDCLEIIGDRLVKSGNIVTLAKITAHWHQYGAPGRYSIDPDTLRLTPINQYT